jgi:pantoate--beta-alanine ligase
MGNLHEGHLQLVRQAKANADFVVVSIFVNPLQFGVGEDYSSYPRTLDQDRSALKNEEVEMLFLPTAETIYPDGEALHTQVLVPGISDIHCGESRPDHFRGVATIVCKLLNIVQPDFAIFGKKDYQQLMVIRRMVRDLVLPVDILGVDTVRESDGLALSSRNAYLDQSQRELAPQIYAQLQVTANLLEDGDTEFSELERRAAIELGRHGFNIEYYRICNAEDLRPADLEDEKWVILVAARIGKTRLIDNLEVERQR